MVIKENVLITPFDDKRTLHIYLPDDIKDGERFEVIYMFDGHNLFYDQDATYGSSWGLKDIFDKKKVRKMVVGLECNHEGNKRLFEFSPYDFDDKDYGKIQGLGKELFRWMVDELKPYIDDRYPTLKDRDHTAIGGSSMGGLMALYGAIAHSDIYAKALAVSPHIIHCMSDILYDIKSHDTLKDTMIYLSFGSEETRSKRALATYTDDIFKIQRALNVDHLLLHIFKGHDHSERSWRKEVPVWLKEVFGIY